MPSQQTANADPTATATAALSDTLDKRDAKFGQGRNDGKDPSETMISPTASHKYPRTLTTLPPQALNVRRLAELAERQDDLAFFNGVANSKTTDGEDVLTLEGYLDYFGITNLTRETEFGRDVAEKFRLHDRNGDGVLTFAEYRLHCGADGCNEK